MKLKEKKLLSDAVTGETKRILAILKRNLLFKMPDLLLSEEQYDTFLSLYKSTNNEIIKDTPFLEHNTELRKRILK